MSGDGLGAVSRRAPGKLYVAGEYAVVEPGHRAVLVAVDRFITVTVSPVHDPGRRSGRIASSLYAGGPRSWRRRPEDGIIDWRRPAAEIERLVEMLVHRKRALTRPDQPLRLLQVVDEAAFASAVPQAIAGFERIGFAGRPVQFGWCSDDFGTGGVIGDPTTATAAIGETLAARLVADGVATIDEIVRWPIGPRTV
mgnify:CR=1 FL=1